MFGAEVDVVDVECVARDADTLRYFVVLLEPEQRRRRRVRPHETPRRSAVDTVAPRCRYFLLPVAHHIPIQLQNQQIQMRINPSVVSSHDWSIN